MTDMTDTEVADMTAWIDAEAAKVEKILYVDITDNPVYLEFCQNYADEHGYILENVSPHGWYGFPEEDDMGPESETEMSLNLWQKFCDEDDSEG